MLATFRIIIAGSLLFGSTILNAPAHAGFPDRVLPRAEQTAKGGPCKAIRPYLIHSCVA